MTANTFLNNIHKRTFNDVLSFHGHSCAGLALGYVAALYARELLDLTFSEDEEIVVITETDSCMVDSLQVILGTTAGKGNLFVNNWGKSAFSFYNRTTGKSVRLMVRSDFIMPNPELDALFQKVISQTDTEEEHLRFHELSDQHIANILSTPGSKIFEVKEPQQLVPKRARIFDNIICPICGESVGAARCVEACGQQICQFCAQNQK
ncbi:MAG: FmdE family protein [Methanosarcinales archaeon]|jgi:formylmethanofuran dehydrogenase subunit E|nr:FmdE family protein [Methanosarcinales archaeon]